MRWGTTGGATVADISDNFRRYAPLTIEGLQGRLRAQGGSQRSAAVGEEAWKWEPNVRCVFWRRLLL